MNLRHIVYEPNPTREYKLAILIKDSCFNNKEIKKYYIEPLQKLGLKTKEIVVFNLEYTPANKAPVKIIKEYLPHIFKAINGVKIKTLLVADPNYFKVLTKSPKVEVHHGYVLDCKIPKQEHLKVILSTNYASLFYNPELQSKIDISLQTAADHILRIAIAPGTDVIRSESYPDSISEISKALVGLHKYEALTVDIETYSLDIDTASIATIAFAWNKHEGLAFCVDWVATDNWQTKRILKHLLLFFKLYKGKLIYHGATFDVKMLIYKLFMKDFLDTKGMLKGLDIMYKNTDCTKIIIYLATNSTAGNTLGLKPNAAEFAGNWAQEDIEDITKIDIDELLKYNLVDALSTWYVYDKYYPKLVADNQLDVYNNIMRPSMKVVTQMELVGMPMNAWKIGKVEDKLYKILVKHQTNIAKFELIQKFTKILKMEALITKNESLKKKQIGLDYFDGLVFNPNSNKQIAKLLHDYFELDVIDITPTGAPSVGGATLKKHLNNLIKEFNITDEELT